MLEPSHGGLGPPPTGNPGSAPGSYASYASVAVFLVADLKLGNAQPATSSPPPA